MIPQERFRNFCIIAHIDHGKSTLADRLLELTHTIDAREMTQPGPGFDMDLEREHGHHHQGPRRPAPLHRPDGETYALNLIDTPGHVDFTYEVSRVAAGLRGRDPGGRRRPGVEAQTLANVYLALENDLEIIPVLNKIDLPSAQPALVIEELESVLAIPREEVILASAKEGTGVVDVLEAVVRRIPPPGGDPAAPARGTDLRLPLRRLQGRGGVRAARRGHAARPRIGAADGVGRGERTARARRLPAPAGAGRDAVGRRSRLRRDRTQERARLPGG